MLSNKKHEICLRLYYNRSNSILYATGVKIYQFKSKD